VITLLNQPSDIVIAGKPSASMTIRGSDGWWMVVPQSSGILTRAAGSACIVRKKTGYLVQIQEYCGLAFPRFKLLV
jgi:hypothetical protein